ncbi:MAG: Mur ligase family protein [Candidatus Colwellbacteria bacterium]|nr:Mur ligase family protein [Candidatus Colwellbacteria bacterium]
MVLSWTALNVILEGMKKFPPFRALYKLPWVPSAYHYCLAFVGALIYRFPSKKLKVIGITGTKGKTTTLEFLNAGLEMAGSKTALLSSVRIKIDKDSKPNLLGNTQPGRFFAQYFMREAVKKGCEFALLEIGSEGVVCHRHRFIDFDAAAFVNIHPEHIESHGSFEKYREAKLKFFRYVRRSPKKHKKFFVNQDDKNADLFIQAAGREEVVLTVKTEVPLRMSGEFNRENAGLAEAVLRSFGVADGIITRALKEFNGVPGRMEYVQKEPFAVVVDYAHTPDSLEAVYKSLQLQSGKLVCVLGSAGGGRDKWKRPKMGNIAAQYCATVILTDEDTFDEDPAQILEEIEMGIPAEQGQKLEIILDRRQAIQRAVALAEGGDTVIITGKGSEPYLRVAGGRKIPWSDVGVAKEILGYTSPKL